MCSGVKYENLEEDLWMHQVCVRCVGPGWGKRVEKQEE